METAKLKKFAQFARRKLMEQVSVKLGHVLADNSQARRENSAAVKQLEERIKSHDQDWVIERVAYIWFNRFCALRFMDANRYTRIGVVTPAEGQSQPEVLAEAKMGHIDDTMVSEKVAQTIGALLAGKTPSRDPQGEAYRLLVVAACNYWNRFMPFLFQRIDDYTELLMPDDLLSEGSVLATTREALTEEACEDVEVIGWLYQFYISEKKDAVFEGLKKNQKITPNNIPAATQLFTPHWIVRYLVENSLGRLWLLNRPSSTLAKQMEYYICPAEGDNGQSETDFLVINCPEDIKICDPACGSGHMLTYAFDLLYAIYEEEGYEPSEIPSLILTHNLFGIEIDERAGELAAFALTMKARAKQRRFFNKNIKPNICVLENIHFEEAELTNYMDVIGRDMFTAPLQTTLTQFEEADNFGSLIRPEVTDVKGMFELLEAKNVANDLFLSKTHSKVLQVLNQTDYLSPKYHVVVANPPYMGGKGMNKRMGAWIKEEYPESKYDLFSAFMERGIGLTRENCFSAMVTMESWMFLSSFSKMRTKLLEKATIRSLVHMPYSGKGGTSMGINFGTSAFVTLKACQPDLKGHYCCVRYYETDDLGVPLVFPTKNERLSTVSSNDMRIIPGMPIAYWVSEKLRYAFASGFPLKRKGDTRQGMATSDNNRFLRQWYEVDLNRMCFGAQNREEARKSKKKWFPYNKGGAYRRWYGNLEHVVNWENDGEEVLGYASSLYGSPTRTIKSISEYFKPSISWSKVTTSGFSMRYFKQGFIFDVAGCSMFSETERDLKTLLGFTNSTVAKSILASISPTLNFEAGQIALLPVYNDLFNQGNYLSSEQLIEISQGDWDSYETSWDFKYFSLISPTCDLPTLAAVYNGLRAKWKEVTLEMQRLEEENNRIFIEAYGLQDELTPEVPLKEITLTCNPHYRYGGDKSEEELEALLLADTMRELVSYAVGCMFGRYALDKPGLILANQGETIQDYLKQIPEPQFPADDDNVIPLLGDDWFTDDITQRFREFLRVAFGEEHYEENLKFVEQGLNIKGKRNYSIRDYFLNEFYNDHVKRYKKRPIYWLFSSPKGSFNALIYLHRYRPDTASVVLNDYLREFRTKLTARKNHLEAVSISGSASQSEKTKALKEIEKTSKMITELEEYEREVLYPLATQQIEIDLDDGVKVNYPKFGAALKKIPGL